MANEYLTRTPTSSGNRKVFTWSGWVKTTKESKSGNGNDIFFCASSNDTGSTVYHRTRIGKYVQTEHDFGFNHYDGANDNYASGADFRDFSSWSHYFCSVDTTKEQTSDRVKIYVNGVRISDLETVTAINQNLDTFVNGLTVHYVGADGWTTSPSNMAKLSMSDVFFVDGQALTPDVFGFYKDGDGYMSSGTTNATDFRPGQWMPHAPRVIKKSIERSGGFGVNGFYLPMNDSSNPGADFHCAPNSIITLKGEDLPQPRNGAPTTSDAYVSQLREETGTLGFDGAVKFDGNGDYLTLPVSSDFAFGTGDFTVEMFVYHTDLTGQQTYFGDTFGPTSGLYTYKTTNNEISLYDTAQRAVSVANVIKKGQWQHLAWTVSSGVLRQFVDGYKVTETSYNGNYTVTEYFLGDTAGTSSGEFIGFMSNVRIIKGTALYTSNFTPPTEPLTNVTNTKLLCCNSSTSATAATVTPGTITANGDVFATRNVLTGSIVLAVPGISTSTSANLVTNGTFDSGTTGWTVINSSAALSVDSQGRLQVNRNGTNLNAYQYITTEIGKRYTLSANLWSGTGGNFIIRAYQSNLTTSYGTTSGSTGDIKNLSFTALETTTSIILSVDNSGTAFVDNIVVKQEDAPTDYSADIKGSGSNKTLTAVGNAGVGYELGGYYDSAMQMGSGANRFTFPAGTDFAPGTGDFTVEGWGYPTGGNDGVYEATYLYSQAVGGQNYFVINFGTNTNTATGVIAFTMGTGGAGGGGGCSIIVNGIVPRNQWSHFAVVRDGTTVTLYLNGVAVGTATGVTFDLNNTTFVPTLGAYTHTSGSNFFYNGYVQDFRFYKGIAKYKGGFDVPKPYTPVGIEEFRTTADTCKNNFATLNPLASRATHTNGNLTASFDNSVAYNATISNFMMKSGKWYCEVRFDEESSGNIIVGVHNLKDMRYIYGGGSPFFFGGEGGSNDFTVNNGVRVSPIANDGDIIRMKLDLDSSPAVFSYAVNNGAFIDSESGVFSSQNHLKEGETYGFVASDAQSGVTGIQATFNFGQNPSFSGQTTAGTNADGNGKGLFKYAPPTGFLALCEDNLPTPTIADPGKHFKTVLYTGTATSKSIKKVGFQPDLVWVKKRSTLGDHKLVDSVRGTGFVLESNTTDVEGNETINFTGFNSDGFDLGNNGAGAWNENSHDYVAWCWKAGGAAVSNTDGSITTQVSANQTAGFSIVKGTQTSGTTTFGHGLGKAPKMIITKQTNGTTGWYTWHTGIPITEALRLDNTTASTSFAHWVTLPTDSVFSMGSGFGSGETYIAYCWTEIEGFSKFGSYVGNGSADGPFVYCGFKPAWVMIRAVDSLADWTIMDNVRSSTNPNRKLLYANLTNVEGDGIDDRNPDFLIDFLSNGFKVRATNNDLNAEETYIFMAFAESPFQTANAK